MVKRDDIVLGVLVCTGVCLITQHLIARSAHKRLNEGRANFESLKEITYYLLDVINENDIEMTEFDLIALNAICEGN